MLSTPQKIERIQFALQDRGHPGTLAQIAQLLNVNPTTVWRWANGEVKPRGKQQESLEILYRSLIRAEAGDEGAQKIVGAVLGGAAAGVLGLGIAGVLIAAGMSWLIGEFNEEKEKKGRNSQ